VAPPAGFLSLPIGTDTREPSCVRFFSLQAGAFTMRLPSIAKGVGTIVAACNYMSCTIL
jgi:hypothetical protein